jgi:LAGLIDADG endonuclease
MKKQDWIYLAGLFDGEGCVTIAVVERKSKTRSCKSGAKAMNLSLRIANNDPRVLLWLENNFGGRVREHGGSRKQSWVWIVQGEESVIAAQNLLPYSRMKKDQLEKFIALSALKRKNGSNQKVTDKEWEARMKLISEIRASPYRRRQVGLRLISSEAL